MIILDKLVTIFHHQMSSAAKCRLKSKFGSKTVWKWSYQVSPDEAAIPPYTFTEQKKSFVGPHHGKTNH